MYKLTKTKTYLKGEKTYGNAVGKERLAKMESDLATSPTYNPAHIKKMVGTDSSYRYKIGEFRVIYDVHEGEVEVLMLLLKPRGSAY